jgi:hypothetical protein
MRLSIVGFLIAASFIACAGPAKFQAGKPIEVQHRAVGNVYKQDGNDVDVNSMLNGLTQVDDARSDAQAARGWLTAGMIGGAIGGGALGFGVVSGANGNSTGWAIAGIGAGITAATLLVAIPFDRRLESAVGTYNRRTASERPAPSARILPAPMPLCDARGGCGPGAGFALAF